MGTIVVELCLFFLTLASVLFGVLIARRWLDERRTAARDASRRQVTKLYLASLRGDGVLAMPDNISLRLQREAVSHILQLVRGAEREKLLAVAEKQGLFEQTIATASSRSAAHRAEAIQTLEQFGSHQCIEALVVIMANDRKEDVRLAAAGALARLKALPSPSDTISLLQLDERKPMPLHRVLFLSLAGSHPDQLRELLEGDLRPSLRVAVIEALPYTGDAEDIDALELAARDADPEVRIAALRAASRIGDHRSAPWVTAALDDPAEMVRMQAATATASLGLRRLLPRLEQMLDDPSPWVRMRADEALTTLDPRRATRAA